jgi:hypothetical protein
MDVIVERVSEGATILAITHGYPEDFSGKNLFFDEVKTASVTKGVMFMSMDGHADFIHKNMFFKDGITH